MSAYLVDSAHIAEIVKFAENHRVDYAYNCATKEPIDCDPKNLVKILAKANIDSVNAKYEQDQSEVDGYYIDECLDNLKYSTDGIGQSLLTGVGLCQLGADDIYNMIQCWEYQSCEVDNWHETDAYWLGVRIKDTAGRKLAEDAKVKWSYYKNGEVA